MLKANKINTKWLALSLLLTGLTIAMLWSMQPSLMVTRITVITLISLISLSWAFMGPTSSSSSNSNDLNAADRFESRNNLRSVGLKLQGMGQLSLAYEKFKQCPHNHDTANLLFNLATDFQIKGEPEFAKNVFSYIASFEPNFKDVQQRIASLSGGISPQNELPANEITIEAPIADEPLVQETVEAVSQVNKSIAPNPSTVIEKAVVSGKTIILSPGAEPEDEIIIGEELDEYPTLYGSRYKIQNVLGQGTTGAVFKGRDIVTDEIVAVKVLNLSDELEDEQLDEYKFRFHREIETAGNLNHPNIVKILDSGETDGFAYIAMEYVDGTNLRNYARADQLLQPKSVLKIIAQCADALAYAHKQDLIHRDIKPANIIYNLSLIHI